MSSVAQLHFTLHYWPTIPGRGEFVRLAFESVGQAYTENNDVKKLGKLTRNAQHVANPTHFAVPILEVAGVPASFLQDGAATTEQSSAKVQRTEGSDDAKTTSAYISQTAAILAYLAPILDLDGVASLSSRDEPIAASLRRAQVLQLTLSALDVNTEAHDTHHPISSSEVYENQIAEAKLRSADFRAMRLPKYLEHFNTALLSNTTDSGWLIGSHMTVADLTVFQVIDGLLFAFPARMAALKKAGDVNAVFAHHDKVATTPKIAAYLESKRRKQYGNGIYRYYAELDKAD